MIVTSCAILLARELVKQILPEVLQDNKLI